MKRAVFILLLLVFLALSGAMGKYFYDQSREVPDIFETEKAFVGNVIKKTVATGAIVPRREVAVKAQVTGVVEELFVEAGQQVSQGQLIARIRVVPDEAALQNGRENVTASKIAYDAAEVERVRQERLFQNGTIAEQAYLAAVLSADQAKQQLQAAESALQVIRTGAAKGSKTAANLVRSTADGMVLDVPVEQGNSVIQSNNFNEGTTIISVANMNEMIFEGKVDESEVGKLTEGMVLELTVGAIDKRTFPARLDFISPKGINEEGTIKFEIRAAVSLPEDAFLRAGYSANADIVLDRRDSVLLIRESWVQFADDTAYVEVAEGEQRFKRIDLDLGLSDGLVVEVLAGVDSTLAIKVPK